METTPSFKQLTSHITQLYNLTLDTSKECEDTSTLLLLESQELVNHLPQTPSEKSTDSEFLLALQEIQQLSLALSEAATKLLQDSRLVLVSYLKTTED